MLQYWLFLGICTLPCSQGPWLSVCHCVPSTWHTAWRLLSICWLQEQMNEFNNEFCFSFACIHSKREAPRSKGLSLWLLLALGYWGQQITLTPIWKITSALTKESSLRTVVFPTDEQVLTWLSPPVSLNPVQATHRKGPSVHLVGLCFLLPFVLVVKQLSLSPNPPASQGSLFLDLDLRPGSETPAAASFYPFLTGPSLSPTDLSSVFPSLNNSAFFLWFSRI